MEDASVGTTLRRARELAEIDDRQAARALGVSRRRLHRIESGSTEVPADLIDRAVREYGSDRFELPDRQELVHPDDPDVLRVGTERIPFDPVFDGNRTVLVRYLAAVRRQRGLDADDPVEFRSADLAALAGVLDLTADDLDRELSSLAGLDGATSRRTVRMLVLTGLCVLAAGGATLQTRSWFAADPASSLPAAEVAAARAPALPVPAVPAPDAQISTAASTTRSTDLVAVPPTWALAPPSASVVPAASPFTVTASLPVEDVSPFSVDPRPSPDGDDHTFHLFTVSA
jgi:transcriptional regulator with XRE-family HTH domain